MVLNIAAKQTQTLSPQMIQAMEILQMNTLELAEYLEMAALENPVLELEPNQAAPEDLFPTLGALEWLADSDPQNFHYHKQDTEAAYDALDHYGTSDIYEESLYDHICASAKPLGLSPELFDCVRFLAASLNHNGWLDEPLEDLARDARCPVNRMEQALAIIQSMEPAGIGARSLSECLRLQLLRRQPPDKLAEAIAANHLEALARHHYGQIAKELGVTQERVRQVCQLIRSLNPHPASDFTRPVSPIWLTPDVIVVRESDRFEVLTNDRDLPILNISPYYVRMLKTDRTPEVRAYLSEKVRMAKSLSQAVEQRRGTLLACARTIVDCQQTFFVSGPGHLLPLSLRDVADQVGVHESTVSRAVRDKYLQCSSGTYPLSSFFSRSLGCKENGSVSADTAKSLLRKLISEEDKRKPLSDQKLCELLAAQNCAISRRTVAKYREELHIPGTSGRKSCSAG